MSRWTAATTASGRTPEMQGCPGIGHSLARVSRHAADWSPSRMAGTWYGAQHSAGTTGANNDTTASYPANYAVSNIIAVAATTQSNGLASFSNYGAGSVDIGAPGCRGLLWERCRAGPGGSRRAGGRPVGGSTRLA